jgi:hypothetical protein
LTLFRLQTSQGWGYINSAGEWVISPQFSDADLFVDGLAAVAKGNRYGFITEEGQWAISPKFDWAWQFASGVALTFTPSYGSPSSQPATYRYITPLGETVLEGRFHRAWNASENKLIVQTDEDHFACYSKTGDRLFQKRLAYLGPFHCGLAVACERNFWGFLNESGHWVIEPQFDALGPFACETLITPLAPAKQGRQSGYINPQGEWAFQLPFIQAGPFKEGLAMTQCAHKNGNKNVRVVTPQGDVAFEITVDDAGDFEEGMAWIRLGDQFGFMNTQGNVVITPQYDFVQQFHHGLAYVANWPQGWFYIDRKGQPLRLKSQLVAS